MSLTPHGPGFRFIESVEAVEGTPPGLRATLHLDLAAPYFADHFPGRPLMPGVFLIEMAAQAAGALWGRLVAPGQFALAQVQDFRLRRQAVPGETLVCEVRLERDFGSLALFAARIQIRGDDATVAAGKVTLARPQP